ncbi:hypothetical protein HanRHA438_Chr09g0379541 [Helianthus annuus]|nr:hypothetical protein HanHA300_Chr09g0302941 [Helianthus annuus]KAJ0532449.1 hypothetical protein HanIR_Chr09g0397001 [Helianthus annuus]KAJ0540927.1 hypothetical protein HanHA89_Chr09g0322631 [Helianthus annuus]KAJ0886445.1 hypothetical protein HanRHA438_Chr09g0379541 [Helianthus annuus]
MGHMQWIKAYEKEIVHLVGDNITKGRIGPTQMLFEYGITSTYLQGIDYESMPTYEYTSSSNFLSFSVPSHQKKHSIRGLSVSYLYKKRYPYEEDTDRWILLAKIRNTTKCLTWVYNPEVYCKSIGNEHVVWLSYWPIGNILDNGDEVHVEIIWEEGKMVSRHGASPGKVLDVSVGTSADQGMIVIGCGASLVYMDGEIEEEENIENKCAMIEEEVIGGDLSEFEVNTGGYYLCRRDLFGSETGSWFKWLFGDNVRYTDSGWRKSHQSALSWDMRNFSTYIP